jgi:hypothetical protein
LKRYVLTAVCGLAATAMLALPATAGAVPGTTLYYKKTYEGEVTRTIAAHTSSGQTALFGFPSPNSYDQYDGKVIWVCEEGKACRIGARGSKAASGGEFLYDNFFSPYSKLGFAARFIKDPKPSGGKTVAGVASSCKSGPSVFEAELIETLCISKKDGFLTLLEASSETYALQRVADRVKPSFLQVPKGVWDGQISG